MRFDIDQQDLVNLAHDTRRGFDRARFGLIFSLSALGVIAAAGAYQAYRAGTAIHAAAGEISIAGFASAFGYAPGAYYAALASAGLVVLCGVLARAILKARRKREAVRKKEIAGNSFAAGRFDYSLALDQLIINGPLAVKKISWSKIERIEKKKSSIIFRRKDGGLEFIPRNVLPKKDFYEQIIAKHGASVGKPCPFEEANHAGPLSVTYEATRADADEYFSRYLRRRDGRLNSLRRLCQWRPWAPILFTVFSALFAACAFTAFRAQELAFAAMSLAFAAAATATFILNSSYFRGPAFPFRKNASWPFAQTDLVGVTLSRNGVHHVRHGLSELIQWAAFERYFETRLYGYLVVSAKTVIPLPKRAFLSKPHYEKFSAFARRAIAEAKQTRSEEKRGRLMRSIGKEKSAEKAPRPAQATAQPGATARAHPPTGRPQQAAKPKAPKNAASVKPAAKKPAPPRTAPSQAKPIQKRSGDQKTRAPAASTEKKPAAQKQAAPKPARQQSAPAQTPAAPAEQKKRSDPSQAARRAAHKKFAAQ